MQILVQRCASAWFKSDLPQQFTKYLHQLFFVLGIRPNFLHLYFVTLKNIAKLHCNVRPDICLSLVHGFKKKYTFFKKKKLRLMIPIFRENDIILDISYHSKLNFSRIVMKNEGKQYILDLDGKISHTVVGFRLRNSVHVLDFNALIKYGE